MKPDDGRPQEIAVEMCVYLCSGDAFMPEHFLYCTQICSSFDQVCGERVAKGMRTDGFFQIYFSRQSFNNCKNHDPRKFCAPVIKEYDVLISRLNGLHCPHLCDINA